MLQAGPFFCECFNKMSFNLESVSNSCSKATWKLLIRTFLVSNSSRKKIKPTLHLKTCTDLPLQMDSKPKFLPILIKIHSLILFIARFHLGDSLSLFGPICLNPVSCVSARIVHLCGRLIEKLNIFWKETWCDNEEKVNGACWDSFLNSCPESARPPRALS